VSQHVVADGRLQVRPALRSLGLPANEEAGILGAALRTGQSLRLRLADGALLDMPGAPLPAIAAAQAALGGQCPRMRTACASLRR